MAAELASLIVESIKAAGKHHEWLYALKLQAEAKPTDKQLRAEIVRPLASSMSLTPVSRPSSAVSEIDQNRTPLPTAIIRIETLLALQVGTYGQHKSWGVGRVKSFDATLGQIVVSVRPQPVPFHAAGLCRRQPRARRAMTTSKSASSPT
jgi:transcription elongation factor GreA-like protein